MKTSINFKKQLNNRSAMSKKAVLIIAMVLAPLLFFGQGLFDKYEDVDNVASIVVNSKMFSMLSSINIDMDNPEDQKFFEMVKKIKSLKVLTTDDKTISANMKADLAKHIKSTNLEELMRFKDGNQTVKFYVREGSNENYVKELLMFVSGLKELTRNKDIVINGKKREVETVIVSIVGDIDLREISKITSKMNIPGGKHLKKASKNKK